MPKPFSHHFHFEMMNLILFLPTMNFCDQTLKFLEAITWWKLLQKWKVITISRKNWCFKHDQNHFRERWEKEELLLHSQQLPPFFYRKLLNYFFVRCLKADIWKSITSTKHRRKHSLESIFKVVEKWPLLKQLIDDAI